MRACSVLSGFLLAALVASSCESSRDKATRMLMDAVWDVDAGELKAALEKARQIKDWDKDVFADFSRRASYWEKLFQIEGHVIAGKTSLADVEALVEELDNKKMNAWWKRRKDVLDAWSKKKSTPRLTIEFVDDEGNAAPGVENKTRRGVLAALAMCADGIGFEMLLDPATGEEPEALRSVPGSVPGEVVGTMRVNVTANHSYYEGDDTSGALTTGQQFVFTVKSDKETTWEQPVEIAVSVKARKEVTAGEYGGVDSDAEVSSLHELADLLVEKISSVPPLKLK